MLDSMYAQWADTMAPWILPLALLALLLTPTGVVFIAWSGRRRFDRRNFAGVEEFNSYWHAVGSRLVEGLIDRSGTLLVLVGLLAGFAAGYAFYLQRY